MTLQSILNQQAIDALPQIKKIIHHTKDQSIRDQMIDRTLRAVLDSVICLDNMNDTVKNAFENDLIEIFKYKNWM